MKCPTCGYVMGDFDADCPRCKNLAARGAIAQPAPKPVVQPVQQPQTPMPSPALNPNAPLNVGQLVYALIVFGILALVWLPFQCSRTVSGSLGGNTITLSEYEQVQNGMSYEQVKAIVGEPGQEQSRTEFMGITNVSYVWQNPDGSNMICMFQGDKMNTKAQAGLH